MKVNRSRSWTLESKPWRWGNRTTNVVGWSLALGEHTDDQAPWPRSNFRPSSLHEWYPETGLSISRPESSRTSVILEWNAPERQEIELPSGVVSLSPGADWSWRYAPDWSIETSMTFAVQPSTPLVISDHWERFGNPLLGFMMFAADRPEGFVRESYYDPASKRGIVLMRRGRLTNEREWHPGPGRFLFTAADLRDTAEPVRRWFAIWTETAPSLGLLGDSIREGCTYSVPRFLTLYTAAESYWKNTKTTKAAWSPRELAKRAAISPALTGATDDAVALIGASREYHAHLTVGSRFSPEEIVSQTLETTRRLHALLQACLMRDLGLETADIERLMAAYYRSWQWSRWLIPYRVQWV